MTRQAPGTPAVEAGSETSRRDFLRQGLLLLLGTSALGTALSGCEGDDAEAVLQTLATVVNEARAAISSIVNSMAYAETLDASTVATYLSQVNAALVSVQALAATAPQNELRALVQSDQLPALTQLDGYGEALDYSQAAPQFTAAGLTAAVDRADALLEGFSAGVRRGLWVYTATMSAILPAADEALIPIFASNAHSSDTEDVGGRLYDAIFGSGQPTAQQTGLSAPGTAVGLSSAAAGVALLAQHSHAVDDFMFLLPLLLVALVLMMMYYSPQYSIW